MDFLAQFGGGSGGFSGSSSAEASNAGGTFGNISFGQTGAGDQMLKAGLVLAFGYLLFKAVK